MNCYLPHARGDQPIRLEALRKFQLPPGIIAGFGEITGQHDHTHRNRGYNNFISTHWDKYSEEL